MKKEEMREIQEIKSCDYKHCHKRGGIYIGDMMDYEHNWLSEREKDEPTIPMFLCEKHAKKVFKMLGVNKSVL